MKYTYAGRVRNTYPGSVRNTYPGSVRNTNPRSVRNIYPRSAKDRIVNGGVWSTVCLNVSMKRTFLMSIFY